MSEPLFYIQNTVYFNSDSALWWRPNRGGYTCNLNEAGKYSREEAKGIERLRRGVDKAWPVEEIDAIAGRHVSVHSLLSRDQGGNQPQGDSST